MPLCRIRKGVDRFRILSAGVALVALFLIPLACGGGGGDGPPSSGGPTIPQVIDTVPDDGETTVSTTITAEIHFSEAMSQASVEDNIFMRGYAGTPISYWNTGSTILYTDFSSDPLDTNTTYTISIFTDAEDQEGDKLATPVNFAFSTGPTLATGSISGTISHDPGSDYDNSLGNTIVAVTGSDFFGTGDSEPIVIIQADPAGNYIFDHLEDGDYYVIAVQETTGDEIHPTDGDSIGVWRDVLAHASSTVSVASTVSGVDFTLHDPEAITGDITYAGANTGDPSTWTLEIFAYIGTIFWDGTTKLAATSDEFYDFDGSFSPVWSYSLNPFFDSVLSVDWNFASMTGTVTGLTYIPPDNYRVAAHLYDAGVLDAVGFAQNQAVIADTGADAPGIDIVTYDVETYAGEVRTAVIGTGALYQGAKVSLLDWPFMTVTSDTNGGFVLPGVPMGFPVAIHTEPDPADAGSFYTVNSQFYTLSMSDFMDTHDREIISRNLVAQLTSLCGITTNPSQAIVGGDVQDISDNNVIGTTVTLSAPSTVFYFNSPGPTCSSTPPTQDVPDGFPQFIFQATPTSNGKAILSATHASYSISSVTIPVRAGELTTVGLKAD